MPSFANVAIATLALSGAAFATPMELETRKDPKCIATPRVQAMVRANFEHPKVFCDWWLSEARSRSPLPALAPYQVSNACTCISVKRQSKKAGVANYYPAKPGCGPRVKGKGLIQGEVTESLAFCNFWNGNIHDGSRATSPFPNIKEAVLVANACQCIIDTNNKAKATPKPASSAATKPATTATTKTASASSTITAAATTDSSSVSSALSTNSASSSSSSASFIVSPVLASSTVIPTVSVSVSSTVVPTVSVSVSSSVIPTITATSSVSTSIRSTTASTPTASSAGLNNLVKARATGFARRAAKPNQIYWRGQ